MGKSSPPPPDYVGAAEATGDASKAATQAQTYANRPNVYTPWGSQTWGTANVTDPSTGEPVTGWAQQISLTPQQQAALDSQQNVQTTRSRAAEGFLSNALSAYGIDPSNPSAGGNNIDFSGLAPGGDRVNPGQFSGNGGYINQMTPEMDKTAGEWRQQAQQAVEQLQAPQLKQQRSALETKLANQGITQGSEAWTNAMRSQGDNETRAGLAAIEAGRGEASQLFGQDLQGSTFKNSAQQQLFNQTLSNSTFGNQAQAQRVAAGTQAGDYNTRLRQQQMTELLQKRGLPLNELNALLTGQQVAMPSMPGASQAGASQGANYSNAMNSSYGAALDASNAQNAGTSQAAGAAASMIAAYMMA